MSIENDKRIFSVLRPYCVKLSQIALAPQETINAQSQGLTIALQDVYDNLNSSVNENDIISTNLADYIFVPISYLLKLPELNDITIKYILKILTILIRNSWNSPNTIPYVLAKQLFPLITFLTGGPPSLKDNEEKTIKKSDELKLAGSITLNELFKSLSKQKNAKIYDFFSNVENLPPLGHSVTVLLDFAHKSNDVSLRLQSIKTLNTLYFQLINDGEVLSYILPGNVSTLTKILVGKGSKVHFTILVECLKLLNNLLVLVYNDKGLQVKYNDIETIDDALLEEFEHIQLNEANFQKVHRTKSWLKGTSNQIKLALQNLISLSSHLKLEVRETLLNFCKSILNNCLVSLNTSIPILIRILSHLSDDKELNIDKDIFEGFENQQFFQGYLSKEINESIESFSSTIQSPNNEKIESALSSIKFTSSLNKDHLLASKLARETIIEVSDMLNKKLKKHKIISSSSDPISDLLIISKDFKTPSRTNDTLTIYDTILTQNTQLKLADLFQSLGGQIDPTDTIQEILVDDFNKSLSERGLSLWVANNLMLGYLNSIKPEILADEFLNFEESNPLSTRTPEFVYLILDYSRNILDEIHESQQTLEIEHVNSVAVNSIGIIANFMQSDFENELVDYLYPVIDSLASSSALVRSHALNTSMIIADNLYGGSLYQLVLSNTDFLIDAISIRLSNAMTTRTTAILTVCTKLAGFEILDSFKDVLEIIFSLLDYYHGYAEICIDFFVLFEIIIDEIHKNYINDIGLSKIEFHDSTSSYKPWGLTNVNQLINLLDKNNRDFQIDLNKSSALDNKEKNDEEGIEAEIGKYDSDDEDDNDEVQQEERKFTEEVLKWVSPVPRETYKLTQQIIYYGERLLTHPSAKLQIQILRTFKKALPIFATQINNLYPIVASIWPIVSHLVNSKDPKIIIPASEFLSDILSYSGTFVAQRFVDLWQKSLRNHEILVSATKNSTKSKKLVLPGLNLICYNKLTDMLITAIDSLGKSIPDILIYEIIETCVGVLDDIERFGQHSDIAWIIKQEKYGITNEMKKPDALIFNGKVYEYLEIH
ncbi:hypothetical protein WICMUC_002569 [Wickerhamomyces mucosus]|uniref:Uncharacterized protein n=1 Tax=Wickerhamomyces mucosus TaxID=1378264 RepID=A0A9P8PPF0_9ASCO|nr:hypothetical protein WICMUC_002569 [Wickerhamomyces mucosus]